MSADESFLTVLRAASPVTSLVASRIAADRVEHGTPLPFIVFTGNAEPQRGLDGTVHGTKTTFEIQCWSKTRKQANQIADAVKTALDGQHQYTTGPVNGFDEDLDLECAIVTCEWWDD